MGKRRQMRSLENKSFNFKTLSQVVYLKIRDDIIDGKLKPGTRLVRRTLAKKLEVSVIPVTEALWRLEQDGLVESYPMHGARVKALTEETVKNEQVLRVAIECQTARLCSRNATQREFNILMEEAILLDQTIAKRDMYSKEGSKMHFNFHLRIAEFCGFPFMQKELEKAGLVELMRLNWINATVIKLVPKDWHQQLVRALATKDPDYAEKKMREHVHYGDEHIFKALKQWEKDL